MKLIIDSLDDISILTKEQFQKHFKHVGQIDNILKGKKHFELWIPDPQSAKLALQLSGTTLYGVKIRISYNKSMTKMKRGTMTVDDVDFTLIPIMSRAMKLVVFNLNPLTTEAKLENYIESRTNGGTVFGVHFARKSGGTSTAFIFVDDRIAELILIRCHGRKLDGHNINISYFTPLQKDFGQDGDFVLPRDIPDQELSCVVIEKLPQEAEQWLIHEKVKNFGDVEAMEIRSTGQGQGATKTCKIYMREKSAEILVRYLTRTPFYGKKITDKTCYIEQGFDGQIPDTANFDEIIKPTKVFDDNLNDNQGFNSNNCNNGMNSMNQNMNPMMQNMNPMMQNQNMNQMMQNSNPMMQNSNQMMQNGNPMMQNNNMMNQMGQNNNMMNQMGQNNNNMINPMNQCTMTPLMNQASQNNLMNKAIDNKSSLGKNSSNYQSVLGPTDQNQVNQLIQERSDLETIHPYEEFLLQTYAEGNDELPTMVPPASYFTLLLKRTKAKIKLSKAADIGFDISGGSKNASTAPSSGGMAQQWGNSGKSNGEEDPVYGKRPRN